jgi:hypothetical protein
MNWFHEKHLQYTNVYYLCVLIKNHNYGSKNLYLEDINYLNKMFENLSND